MPPSLGDQLDFQGWQAGAVVPAALLPRLAAHLTRPGQPLFQVEDDHWLVVISQTCDVVQPKLENEPFVELLQKWAFDQAARGSGVPGKYGLEDASGRTGVSVAGSRLWLEYARKLGEARRAARHPVNPRLFLGDLLAGMP